MSSLDQVEARTWRRFAPPPRLTLSQWADQERILPPESSAEPGRWRTDRVPYLREPMNVIADRRVETVVDRSVCDDTPQRHVVDVAQEA